MNRWKMNYPKGLSEQEKELQIKYDILRRMKLKLQFNKNRKNKHSSRQGLLEGSNESYQFYLKKAAGKVLETSDEVFRKESSKEKKTSGFKRSTKQNEGYQAVQKKSVMTEYAPERDLHPRSVTIRGRNLQHKLLLESFRKFGEISKISLGCDNETAVVTYKKPENARMASVAKHPICSKEDTEVSVKLVKQRNSSWVGIAVKESIKYDASSRGRHTVYVTYPGNLSIQDFRHIFRSVGTIEKIYISGLRILSPKKQFAFVTFQYESEAERAVGEVNGKECNGVTLTVSLHKKTFLDSSLSTGTIRDIDSRELITYDCMDT